VNSKKVIAGVVLLTSLGTVAVVGFFLNHSPTAWAYLGLMSIPPITWSAMQLFQ
jgi:hypothetical protein